VSWGPLLEKNLERGLIVGRRAEENASGGTDHGTAGPVLLAGGLVRGRLFGATTNDTTGDAAYTVALFRVTHRSRCGQVAET
jgi:hypothetical protein